jgi:hypothetical protein
MCRMFVSLIFYITADRVEGPTLLCNQVMRSLTLASLFRGGRKNCERQFVGREFSMPRFKRQGFYVFLGQF